MKIKKNQTPQILFDNFIGLNLLLGCLPNGADEECNNCCALRRAVQLAGRKDYIGAIYRKLIKKVNGRWRWSGKLTENFDRLPHISIKGKSKNYLISYMSDIGLAKVETIVKALIIAYKRPIHNYLFLTKFPEKLLPKMLSAIEYLKEYNINISTSSNLHIGVSVGRNEYKERIDSIRKFPKFFRKHTWHKPLLENTNKCNYKGLTSIRVNKEKGHHKRPFKKKWIKYIRMTAKKHKIRVYVDK